MVAGFVLHRLADDEVGENGVVRVAQGDTLEGLAGRYFAPLPRACGFWWVLADFQPDPIVDPTLELDVGRRLVVPSLRVLTDVILSEQRRRFDA